MYTLPTEMRKELQQPIGLLVDEPGLLHILTEKTMIVSVGDLVTYTLLKHHYQPVLCIVDYISKRMVFADEMKELIQSYPATTLKVTNPAGEITKELWDAIQYAYDNLENAPFRIEVNGEEDLAALTAIYIAPPGATVIYGLPNKGVVIVDATTNYKQIVKEKLDRM